ncbi:MAG: hypothetical protein AB7O50_14755 [Pseudolabrys sp.]
MTTMIKSLTAVGAAGLVALATAMSPAEAKDGRNAAAIGGFVAGAAVGAAVANSGRGYYAGPGYYEPDYYGPGYYSYGYSQEIGQVPSGPYPYAASRCWVSTDSDRGYGYYRAC